MINKKDLDILTSLRGDGRKRLTEISKETKIPISTIFDRLRSDMCHLIKKFTCIIDFNRVGFGCQVHIAVKVKKCQREEIKEYLVRQQNINSVYKINNGYDFLIECVFRHVKDVEEFLDRFEQKFKVYDKSVFYIIEEIIREKFMTDKKHMELVLRD